MIPKTPNVLDAADTIVALQLLGLIVVWLALAAMGGVLGWLAHDLLCPTHGRLWKKNR